MGLLSGLEKFGIKIDKEKKIYEDEPKKKRESSTAGAGTKEPPKESDFLLLRSTRCPVCDKNFKSKAVKNGRVKRIGADNDLRPHHEYIDTMKYGITSCPYCGYSAMNDNFEHVSPGQIKLIRAEVCSQIQLDSDMIRVQEETLEPYDYDTAIDRHKLALFCTMSKKGRSSEKAYLCLRTAWLLRGKGELLHKEKPDDQAKLKEIHDEEMEFYAQAYEGFTKALGSESFPMCGMNEATVDFLLAAMGLRLGKYEEAIQYVNHIISSQMANSKTKERAREMKDEIQAAAKESDVNAGEE